MIKVITYGTFDLLHYGHINLLKRAKALGDYLIVAVTSESFDKQRGKINVQQSLIDRIDAVRSLGIADEVIVEEYEGQKINDIIKHNVDIFTVGSDWVGKFDYLNQYCKVVYLDRTEGVSSTSIRSSAHPLRVCLACDSKELENSKKDFEAINGAVLSQSVVDFRGEKKQFEQFQNELNNVDAVFVLTQNPKALLLAKEALSAKKHVFCENSMAMTEDEFSDLVSLAKKKECTFVCGNKTFYSTAYNRMGLLVKSGAIGDVLTLDASIVFGDNTKSRQSLSQATTTILTPVFQLLGTNFSDVKIQNLNIDKKKVFNIFFQYPNCSANIKIFEDIATKEQLIITGSNAYLNIPSPWWKTDSFEICTKNELMNRKFFYKFNDNSIQAEILAFVNTINHGTFMNIDEETNKAIVDFSSRVLNLKNN